MGAAVGLVFLMIVAPNLAPQFVLPMNDLSTCWANQQQLMNALDRKKLGALCWDTGVQSFVVNPARQGRPVPEGESIDEPPKPEVP